MKPREVIRLNEALIEHANAEIVRGFGWFVNFSCIFFVFIAVISTLKIDSISSKDYLMIIFGTSSVVFVVSYLRIILKLFNHDDLKLAYVNVFFILLAWLFLMLGLISIDDSFWSYVDFIAYTLLLAVLTCFYPSSRFFYSALLFLSLSMVTMHLYINRDDTLMFVVTYLIISFVLNRCRVCFAKYFYDGLASQHENCLLMSKLDNLAMRDGLTGVSNRKHLDDRLNIEIKRAKRCGKPLSMILLDVDYFKRYNQSVGHQAGDLCLIDIANILQTCIHRPDDMLARYGGEEFAILLPDTGLESAVRITKKVQDSLKAAKLLHPDSPIGGWATVSVGITLWEGQNNRTLIQQVENALSDAKLGGRNCYVVSS
ncbi:GGDEF domain-containing protein [Shewanella sp. D64]|uniref:diguanylate cyclase n=1 Tax=unclassified Shewanella TaxID=196818 RepID=UPI0022BA29FD|nr:MULTISPECIES: diguanylate cyclase [unclassified Shewanella]MEC4725368.1 GGDEF domain-containing protein [Shewanella sp. D64]MEC4735786.1 GGDEF domain-containing protein [Shewanella sp. E94]WBJ93242.1 GGDEF domain-containing protein [Shewanella sp. MTB7]